MADKELLKNVIDSIVNDKGEEAEINFHKYLPGKMREILGTEEPEVTDELDVDDETEE